ncbi:PREDICTED: E3 ubiquitin-protein ligase RBBP6-like [Pygoscelis adeliae]|uniref:E3 ubiquitin-protein ligase RBBP6-like n=1 Tax=Pygoscelis adeliae TaxID=9238 RepID=UPI0004F4EBBB|nr:PREDICTED: E3 ubiquitin-protein ligase RBBP6-like [Pygoscelis adeliae]
MSHVHYKFFSKLNYETVTFHGPHISLCDLKRQIMGREKLKAANCDLQVTNAQTKEGAWRWRARGLGDRPAGGVADRPVAAVSCGGRALLFVGHPHVA